jgi:hypothetical protein
MQRGQCLPPPMPYLDGADVVDDGDLVNDVDLVPGADVELDEFRQLNA